MSLGAMMRRPRDVFANSVNLITAAPWVVPVGVTALNVYAATPPGGLITESSGGNFGGGSGGGALVRDAVAPVVPGETLTVTLLPSSAHTEYVVQGSITGTILSITTGRNQMNGGVNVRQGGDGSTVVWAPTSQTANIGQLVTITGGGIMIGGANGGTGGTASPPVSGTAGGTAGGTYAPVAGGANYGGGGGGFFPGNAWLTPSTQTGNGGAAFILVRY